VRLQHGSDLAPKLKRGVAQLPTGLHRHLVAAARQADDVLSSQAAACCKAKKGIRSVLTGLELVRAPVNGEGVARHAPGPYDGKPDLLTGPGPPQRRPDTPGVLAGDHGDSPGLLHVPDGTDFSLPGIWQLLLAGLLLAVLPLAAYIRRRGGSKPVLSRPPLDLPAADRSALSGGAILVLISAGYAFIRQSACAVC